MTSTERTSIRVRAVREGRLWVLHLEDGGVTQARHLGEVEAMVADYTSLMRNIPAESIDVEVTRIDPGGGLADEIADARQAQTRAAAAQEDAAQRIRQAANALSDQGLTGVEIARVLGVSPQRISQLIRSGRPRRDSQQAG